MFDLIIAYLVIMFLVNTAKSAKEQQKKGTPPVKKGNPRMPTPTAAPVRPAPQEARRQTVTVSPQKRRETPSQPVIVQRTAPPKEVKKNLAVNNMAVAASKEEETLSRVLEPTEENILTGLVWSEILGPPVAKRPKRY